MAVSYKYERGTDKKKSTGAFQDYLDYLEDPTHEDHEGITLLRGRNFNCGPSRDDLVAAVEWMHENYIRIKDAKKHNRRTYNLWDEVIFNLGEECYISPEERDTIEKKIIAEISPDAPARATWHVNEQTGECDLHIVFSAKRPNGEMTLARTNIGFSKRLNTLDRFAADLLNHATKKPKKRKPYIETAAEVAKRKSKEIAIENNKPVPLPLHVQIAQLAEDDGLDEVEGHHLPELLERLGIRIKEIINGVIYYFSNRTSLVSKSRSNPGAGDIRKSRIEKICVEPFCDKVYEAQIDIRIERDRVKSLEEPTPEPQTKSPAKSVKIQTQPKATDVAKKAALLQRYYEAALGRTKVTSSKLTELANGTKGMLTKSGAIKPSTLKQLTDEQKAILIPMAETLANEIQ